MTSEEKLKTEFHKAQYNFFQGGKYGKLDSDYLDKKLISQRIVSDENFATICYVGQIPNSTGLWLGVDWDDFKRGRHDGSHNGIKYFNTRTAKSGSFVRLGKVSLGLTIEEAIDLRYGCNTDPAANYVLEEFFLESSDSDDECGTSTNAAARLAGGHQKVKVHISGPASGSYNVKSCQLDRLKSAVLHSLPVFRCMTPEEGGGQLQNTLPMLDDLDLAQTLISDWIQVAQICKQLPTIKTLNMSDNKLVAPFPSSDPSEDDDHEERRRLYEESFGNISYLVLVRIYYCWHQFLQLFEFTPQLEHLCLAYNKLSELRPSLHRNFVNLGYLDLACNEIASFAEDVLPLGSLQHLHTLLLNDNHIEDITLPGPCSEVSNLFPKLKLLAVSNNRISSWNAIHHMSRMRSLNELIFMLNPILEQQKNQETARQDVIAKMSRLRSLNRNEIKYDERKGAEIDYLKRYGKRWLEAQSVSGEKGEEVVRKRAELAQFEEEHPRFLGLVQQYGAPEQSEMKEVSRKLKEKLIEVTIEFAGVEGDTRSLKKKIPNHMTVQHLRVLLRKLCRIPAKSEFSLCYVSNARPSIEIALEADTREIGFYNVQTEDRVIVRLDLC